MLQVLLAACCLYAQQDADSVTTAAHEAATPHVEGLPRPGAETSETVTLEDGSSMTVVGSVETTAMSEGTTSGVVISDSLRDRLAEFGIYPDDIFRYFSVTSLTDQERRRLEAQQHYFQARYFMEMEEFAHALGEFKAALEDDTSNPQVMLGMVNANLQLKNFGEARELVDHVLDVQSTNVQALITKARIILGTADSLGGTRRRDALADAVRVLEQAQTEEPRNVETLKSLARAYQAQTNVEKTIEAYRRLIRVDSKDTYSHLMLATLLARSGKREESVEFFKRVIEQRRGFVQGYMVLGSVYEEMKQFDNALDTYQNAILVSTRQDQQQVLAYYEEFLSKLARQKGGRTDIAVEREILSYYEKFAKAYPHSTEVQRIYAERLIRAKDFDRAIQQYRRTLQADPENVEALIAVGNIYNAQKNFDEANRYFARAIEINPDKIEVYENIADNFIAQKDLAKAVEVYEKALNLNPKMEKLYFKLAGLLDQSDKTDEAIGVLQKGIEKAGERAELYAVIGQLFEKQKNKEKALENYRKAFDLTPAEPAIAIKLLSFTLDMGNKDEAEQITDRITTAAGERSRELLPLMGESYFVAGDLERAAGLYEKALSELPDNTGLLTRLAHLYSRQKKYDAALELLDRFEAKNPESQIVAKLRIDTHVDMKEFDKAIDLAKKLLQEQPGSAEAYWDLVEVYVSAERLDDAIAVVKQAEDKFGRSEDTDLRRALAYYRLKKYEPAEKIFRELAQKRGGNASMFYYYIGSIQLDQKKFDAAERSLKKAIELDSKNDSALNALGYMYADQGRKLPEARQLIEKALEINPAGGHILDSMGWVLFKQGKAEEGLDYIQRAIRLLGEDAELLEHLGDIKAAIGDHDEALEYWRKSLTLDESRTSVKKKITEAEKKQQ